MSARVAQEENILAGCSNRPDFLPAQPRRAKTRRSAGKAAADESTGGIALGCVEGLNDARTPLADCFSILLKEVCDVPTSPLS